MTLPIVLLVVNSLFAGVCFYNYFKTKNKMELLLGLANTGSFAYTFFHNFV
jgi:hypothetical protein